MYAFIVTRLNVAHTITLFSHYFSCTNNNQIMTAKYYVLSLNKTNHWVLKYPVKRALTIEVYTEADNGICTNTAWSLSVYIIRLGQSIVVY